MPKNTYFSNLDPVNGSLNLNLVHTPQEKVARRTLEKISKPQNVVIRTYQWRQNDDFVLVFTG